MMVCVTFWMESIPSEVIGGIRGRLKALLCKVHCGKGIEVIVGCGVITVRREVRHCHGVVVAVHDCSNMEVVGTE